MSCGRYINPDNYEGPVLKKYIELSAMANEICYGKYSGKFDAFIISVIIIAGAMVGIQVSARDAQTVASGLSMVAGVGLTPRSLRARLPPLQTYPDYNCPAPVNQDQAWKVRSRAKYLFFFPSSLARAPPLNTGIFLLVAHMRCAHRVSLP